jgi:hypothetical protein
MPPISLCLSASDLPMVDNMVAYASVRSAEQARQFPNTTITVRTNTCKERPCKSNDDLDLHLTDLAWRQTALEA